jgi:hypothetical protein
MYIALVVIRLAGLAAVREKVFESVLRVPAAQR